MLGACACSECATGSESHTFHIIVYWGYIKHSLRQSVIGIDNCAAFLVKHMVISLRFPCFFRCHTCFEYIYMIIYGEKHGKTFMKQSMPMSGIYMAKKARIFGDGAATSLRRAKPRTQQKRRQAVHNLSNATVRKRRGRLWPVSLKGVRLRPQLATHLRFLIQESNVGSRLFEI